VNYEKNKKGSIFYETQSDTPQMRNGTPYGTENIQWCKDCFQDQDFSCIIKRFNVLMLLNWIRIFIKEYMI